MENRNKRYGGLLFLLLFLAAIGPWAYVPEALAQSEKSFIWRVEAEGAAAYLLGSIHLLKKENYPLPPKIEKAFDEADTLVVEANINDESKINPSMIMERAFYPENDTLQSHVSRETYERIREEAGALGIPPEQMDRCRPWFLSITISSLEFMKKGYDPTYGIDHYFLTKAANVKKILELETLDYQVRLLSSLSDTEQELFLLHTLKDLKIADQEFSQLLKAWTSGDSRGMESIMMKYAKEDSRLSGAYEKLIYERNRSMAGKIEGYLKTKGTYFVVVGAAHLIGDKGIIEILRGKGYRVVQF